MMLHRLSHCQIAFGLCLLSTVVSARAEKFSLIAIPDTQFASDSLAGDYPGTIHTFNAQTEWIRDNTASRNIAFTMHLGDVVNNRGGDQLPTSQQWMIAAQAMDILDENNLSYGVARGNHDDDLAGFRQYFGPTRFASVPSYRGSDPGGLQSYHEFEAGGQKIGVLFTDWRMDAEELTWARGVLNANPSTPTILVSHQILNVDQGAPPLERAIDTSNGEFLWEQLVRDNDQIFMTLNGHHQGTGWRIKQNRFGRDVIQMVVDFQFDQWDGAGYLRELVFDLDNDTIEGITFSPWIEKVRTTFPDAVWPFDPNAIDPRISVNRSNDAAHQFVLNMDFAERFVIVPEPTSILALGVGALAVAGRRRRHSRLH